MMKINLKKQDKLIERLGQITNSIKSIYKQMDQSTQGTEEYKKLEEYLKLAIEVEDSIYDEIGQKQAEKDQFLNRLIYQINRSDLKGKETIINRIMNYISTRKYLNPFKPLEIDPFRYHMEIQINIKNQANLDYLKSLILHINQEIEKESNTNKKQKLNELKSSLLFSNKIMETLSKKDKSLKIDGRERCLIFNNPEESITAIYLKFAYDLINHCITMMLTHEETFIEEIELRSILFLLTTAEIQQVRDQVTEFLEINRQQYPGSNANIILQILEESEKVKQNNKILEKMPEKKQSN